MFSAKELKALTSELVVLYVEDDPSIRQSMVAYLHKLCSDVYTANDGEEGWQKYQERDFDIVITDISMPILDGLEMISLIREKKPSQLILVTSAHSESNYVLGAIKRGVDGYIVKPFNNLQLNTELYKVAQKLFLLKENENYRLHLSEMVEKKTRELEEIINFQKENYQKTLLSMVEMIEKRDTYTAGHSKRVAKYSKMIAQQMGYGEKECTMIYQAGILHDVGKIGTPDAVLLNPKSLNTLEYQLIQEHVEVSYKILSSIPMFEPLAEIVYDHHERYDGKGYPRGLSNEQIPELARIMIVADSFDAMTTNRIYKGRKNIKEALGELESLSAKQFDPAVVDAALEVLVDVEIEESLNQLPKTRLEEERFAYFYKDSISSVYNQNYLDVVLMENSHNAMFRYMDIVCLKHFSAFNKRFGWKEGDKTLAKLGNTLVESFEDSNIFRVFGDDFVLLHQAQVPLERIQRVLDQSLEGLSLEYNINKIDLHEKRITSSSEIEMVQSLR